MPRIRLYSFPDSNNSAKVRFLLEEAGVPYELVFVDLKARAHRDPAYLAINPFGQIPAAEIDGHVLYESNAILRRLAREHAPQLYPERDPDRAYRIDLWLDLLSTGYRQVCWPWEQVVLGGRTGDLSRAIGTREEIVHHDDWPAYRDLSRAYLATCEQIHPGGWCAGELSIADIAWSWSFDRLRRMGESLDATPKLRAWSTAILARPAFQRARV